MCASNEYFQFPECSRGKLVADTLFFAGYGDLNPFCRYCPRMVHTGYICVLCYVCYDCKSIHHPKDHEFMCVQIWCDVLSPFLKQPVLSPRTDVIWSDCSVKINALDPANGLGLLNGLLATSKDDSKAMEAFLELAVNAESRFMPPKSRDASVAPDEPSFRQLHITSEDLEGATPLHFAAKYGRLNCLQALLDVGVNLEAKTWQGMTVGDMDGVSAEFTQALVAARKGRYPKSFAHLAKEKKWFAMRYRMRRQRISDADLESVWDGKTAAEWVFCATIDETRFRDDWPYDASWEEPFRILAEMKYRYGEEFGLHPQAVSSTADLTASHRTCSTPSLTSLSTEDKSGTDEVATGGHLQLALAQITEGLKMLKCDLEGDS